MANSLCKRLEVVIPAVALMELVVGCGLKDYDLFATYMRSVKFDSATNFTAFQVMQLVQRLHVTLSDIEGMESVGKELAGLVKPFLLPESKEAESEGSKTENTVLSVLFSITPDHIRSLEVDDAKIRGQLLSPQVRKTAEKVASIDNFKSVFYQITVLLAYYPKTKTFDFYYAYVYCKDTSPFLWALGKKAKAQRMAALELEGLRTLGNTIRRNSDAIEIIEREEGFEDLKAAFQ